MATANGSYILRWDWDDFEAKHLPGDAKAIDRELARRAFYAGAQAVITARMLMMDKFDYSVTDDLNQMLAIESELQEAERA